MSDVARKGFFNSSKDMEYYRSFLPFMHDDLDSIKLIDNVVVDNFSSNIFKLKSSERVLSHREAIINNYGRMQNLKMKKDEEAIFLKEEKRKRKELKKQREIEERINKIKGTIYDDFLKDFEYTDDVQELKVYGMFGNGQLAKHVSIFGGLIGQFAIIASELEKRFGSESIQEKVSL